MAGIRAGDRIIAVDGQAAPGRTPATVVEPWLAGPEGTGVTVSLRGRDGRCARVELERALVPPETVFAERMGDLLMLRDHRLQPATPMCGWRTR